MSSVSKYVKIDSNVLCEYTYNDQNLLSERYQVLVNTRSGMQSFLSTNTSGTLNYAENNLFILDPIENRYGEINTDTYNFLQLKDYSESTPIRYDRMRFYFPINYTFDEYIGFAIRVYTLDYHNNNIYELSNYFYDITNIDRFDQLNFSTPQLQFQEQLWGKDIEIMIPSVYTLSKQREDGNAEPGTINANLTNNNGLSLSAPIMIDFSFITKKDTINNVNTYLADSPRTISFPQVPEFENLGCMIDESDQGDYFEIYGIFNDSPADFAKFIEDSYFIGKRYYVEYVVTMYEENIKGSSSTYIVTENFASPIEFRPIIKFSTTTAIIDVEMKVIDQVDNSQITRKASYGLLGDQVSKYSLSLTKIDVSNVSMPKIYGMKNTLEMTNFSGSINNNNVQFEQVNVPYPVLTNVNNVIAKSDNVKFANKNWYGIGKLQLLVYPYDNIFKIILARDINVEEQKVKYLDLSGVSELTLSFKNPNEEVKCELYTESDEIDLVNGVTVFKLFRNQVDTVRNIFNSGINAFYITSSFNDNTSVYYSGTFKMYDTIDNLTNLNNLTDAEDNQNVNSSINQDPDIDRETVLITRRKILKNTKISAPLTPSTVKLKNISSLTNIQSRFKK